MTIRELLMHYIETDTEYSFKQNSILMNKYSSLSTGEKRKIDDIFICLCGYSLDSIISESENNKRPSKTHSKLNELTL